MIETAKKAVKDVDGDGATDIYGFNMAADTPWYRCVYETGTEAGAAGRLRGVVVQRTYFQYAAKPDLHRQYGSGTERKNQLQEQEVSASGCLLYTSRCV